MPESLTIAGSKREIRKATAYIVEAAQAAGLDDGAVYHCEVAVEEACTNIIVHGCKEDGMDRPCEINIQTQNSESAFIITITDNTPPFDPLTYAEPDVRSDSVKMEPGGWGIFFFRKLMDDVVYHYQDGYNQLVLIKRRG